MNALIAGAMVAAGMASAQAQTAAPPVTITNPRANPGATVLRAAHLLDVAAGQIISPGEGCWWRVSAFVAAGAHVERPAEAFR